MKKATVLLFVLTLVACSSPSTPEGEAERLSLVPAGCTLDSSGSHDYVNWGVLASEKYTCTNSTLSKMTCEFYVSTTSPTRSEYRCEGDPLDPQGLVSSCTVDSTGVREFLDGIVRTDTAYSCGSVGDAACWYYRHIPDCNPPGDPCGVHEDEDYREDFLCQ